MMGLGLDDMESLIVSVTDGPTNVTEVDVTAPASSDIHPSLVTSGDIVLCIMTDIVSSSHVEENDGLQLVYRPNIFF